MNMCHGWHFPEGTTAGIGVFTRALSDARLTYPAQHGMVFEQQRLVVHWLAGHVRRAPNQPHWNGWASARTACISWAASARPSTPWHNEGLNVAMTRWPCQVYKTDNLFQASGSTLPFAST